jgi:Sulfotransferase family
MQTPSASHIPVAIGGVGGSGTRAVASILRSLGYYIGADLNPANDNLWFTLLFKRPELFLVPPEHEDFARSVLLFRAAMLGGSALSAEQRQWVFSLTGDRPPHRSAWLCQRADSLIAAATAERHAPLRWGWKEPNTHIMVDRLVRHFPDMTYIHVMRNGLDMAHSSNQHQLRLWGRLFFGHGNYAVDPYWSLKYWCLVHRRMEAFGKRMGARFFLLNYDDLCLHPARALEQLLVFLGIPSTLTANHSLISLIEPPSSIGRFKRFGLAYFDPADIAYVKQLGFDTSA